MHLKTLVLSLSFLFFCVCSDQLMAQKTAVYGTKTLFEALENPATGVFSDNTGTFQSNFFLPSFSFDARGFGDADTALRNWGLYQTNSLWHAPPMEHPYKMNNLISNNSINFVAAKILLDYKKGRELLLDVSAKAYGRANIQNGAITTLNPDNVSIGLLTDQYLTDSYAGAYTQIALGYRQKITENLAAGIKLGYVSGINYAQLQLTKTRLNVVLPFLETDLSQAEVFLRLQGNMRFYGESENLHAGNFLPNFKNPGLTSSFGLDAKLSPKWETSLYLKDFGFINWNGTNRARDYTTDQLYLDGIILADFDADDLTKVFELKDSTIRKQQFRTALPARLEWGVNGNVFSFWRIGLFGSIPIKSSLSTDLALNNDFSYKYLHLILQAQYNTYNALQLGTHILIKRKSIDLMLGTENLLPTLRLIHAPTKSENDYYGGRTGANVSFGIAFKFGKAHDIETATFIPLDDRRKSRQQRRRIKRTETIEDRE